jgi:hypothetical protein
MNNIMAKIGLSDGQGNTSSTRIVMYVVTLAIIVPACWAACKTGTPLALTDQNLELLGMVLGTKLFQNHQENQTSAPVAPSVPASVQPKPITQ